MTERGGATPPARGPDAKGGPRAVSYARAALLLAAIAALGVYLLQLAPAPVGGAQPASGALAAPTTTTLAPTSPTSTTPATSTTSTTQAQGAPTTSVKVLVANASQTNGVATTYSNQLSSDGWGTLTPVTALTGTSTSSVYYGSGDQAYAQTVATELGVTSPLRAIGVTTPVTGASAAQVVVVIGDDLAAKASPGG